MSLPERTDHRDGLILASAVSNIDIEFVDGVHGDKVLEKTLPPQTNNDLANSTIGSWRAHLNAIAESVSLRLLSTLSSNGDAIPRSGLLAANVNISVFCVALSDTSRGINNDL